MTTDAKNDDSNTVKSKTGISVNLLDVRARENACVGISKVLVIYTGGTIGMKAELGIYKPVKGYLSEALKQYPQFNDAAFSLKFSQDGDILALPLSPSKQRIFYRVEECDSIIDSSDMNYDHFLRIATIIENDYANYDAFVILLGTDTMSYTGSALSFLFKNLGKTVVLTGAQIPIAELRSDGRDNLLDSLIVAGHYIIPEVTIYFNNALFRANRTTKYSADDFTAFRSPNMDALVTAGIEMNVRYDLVFRSTNTKPFCVFKTPSYSVGVLKVIPTTTADTVKKTLASFDGVILESYGAGNIPTTNADVLAEFENACKRGVMILNVTQCSNGSVSHIYEGGNYLHQIGIIGGRDITTEAALAKLSYVLGHADSSIEEKRALLCENLRGEITKPSAHIFETMSLDVMEKLAAALNLKSYEEITMLRQSLFPSLACCAVTFGRLQTLETLARSVPLFQTEDYDKRTPLHVAAIVGNVSIATFLLEHGCSVHVTDRHGLTPLMYAIRFHHQEVIQTLLKAGAHLTQSAHELGGELCKAALAGDTATLQMYVVSGASLDAADYTGRTPLHTAVAHGVANVVFFLLANRVRVDTRDVVGTSPCEAALQAGNSFITTALENYREQQKTAADQ